MRELSGDDTRERPGGPDPARDTRVFVRPAEVPRDLRTEAELARHGYHVRGAVAGWLETSSGVVALYSTTEARRLRGDMWLRPRGAPAVGAAASRAARRATAAGIAEARRVRNYTPAPQARWRQPSLGREPRRWLTELFREGFAIIDVETTGLSARDEVVEVAAVGSDGDVLFESLVRPKLGRVPAAAARIHGLTWQRLCGAPTWPEVVDDLADALAGRRVLAWNAAFDERLVVQSSRAWAIPRPLPGFECAMRAYAVCRGVGSGGLRLSRAAVVEGVLAGSQSHRGGADAALTLAVLRAVHLRQARAA